MEQGKEDTIETLINKQEMVEPKSKPLHKDTDLGYYAGLAMQSLIELYDHRLEPSRYAKEAIELAKELIKQLDEKTK